MASLTRKPNSPYWYCCFTTPDGSRTKRSTKQTNRRVALAVCQEVERAANQSRRGFTNCGLSTDLLNKHGGKTRKELEAEGK